MQTKNYSSINVFPFLLMGILSIVLVSCGSSQYATEDGIYGSDEQQVEEVATSNNSNYYKQYFKTKEAEYESLPEEDLIFTDIDAYVSEETIDDEGYIITRESNYEEGYGAWGSNSDNVTVNIYETGFNNWGWGGWYGNRWGWGGWGGWYGNSWGWGGWGWGGGWYGNAWGYGGWGFGWCSPYFYGNNFGWGGYYGGYYGGNYYGNNVAYNRGRRNAGTGRIATRSNRSGRYSTSETARRNYNSDARNSVSRYSNRRGNTVRNSRNSNSRGYTQNRSTTRPNVNSNRSRSNSSTRPSTTRNRNYSRPSSNSRRSSGFSRPSSSSRSSGSMRSSGGSRSSGSRGGGSRRGGRG